MVYVPKKMTIREKSFTNPQDFGVTLLGPAFKLVPITEGADAATATANLTTGLCRGIWVNTAGTADIVQEDGTVASGVQLLQGPNPIACIGIVTGGTASGLYAMY
jgi:hypothetical protein